MQANVPTALAAIVILFAAQMLWGRRRLWIPQWVAQRGLGDAVMVSLFQPDGPGTPAWLLTGNYRAILEYNCSSYYALSVGLLADEIVN